ncbi:MAG: tetratricopeptide repeat protein [Planctomycetes bacterium]|nr:tetratricopeptide repeat protein [Planctomycetota bacterium]
MADEPQQPEKAASDQPAALKASRLQGRIAALILWVKRSRLRMVIAGSLALIGLGSLFTAWSYVARLAITVEDPATLARALEALDNRNYEEARSIVRRMQQQEDASLTFGSALYVLGAVKASEAEDEWSIDRKRAVYLIAARYLQKAQVLGVPPIREGALKYLLGVSLIRGNQPQAGIDILENLLEDDRLPTTELHSLLTDANLATPDPDLEAALRHNEQVLKDPSLPDAKRAAAQIIRARIFGRLGKVEEAFAQLDSISSDFSHPALLKIVSGRLAITAAEKPFVDNEARTSLLNRAVNDLREAQRLEPLNGKLTRESMYWIGRSHEVRGDTASAVEQYDRISKLYGDTEESIVATIARADLARVNGQVEHALAGYRTVLETVGEPATYVNRLLSLSELKKRLLLAHAYFVKSKQFEQAVLLVDLFLPLFNQIEVTELQAKTYESWGNYRLAESTKDQSTHTAEHASTGRHHLRAAGRAYETLARLRFATAKFTDDLWLSADNYFRGQSYTNAARVLEEYLHHESRKYNAAALLQLGQCLLATKENDKAIVALQECIAMHPRGDAVYQARLECVRAYRHNGQIDKARDLLLTNLRGEELTPASPEWRDSLFALGELYYEQNQFEDAIKMLDEAVTRYPNASRTLLARYTIARAYHSSAKEPSKKMRLAKTENERLKNRKARDEKLEAALENYRVVQKQISVHDYSDSNMLLKALSRNCYMMQGSVLFQLNRFFEARIAYGNVSTLFQDEPFVLESFVHIANCWRRLNQPIKARGTIAQAKLVLGRLPKDTNFKVATNFNREKWASLLNEMEKW